MFCATTFLRAPTLCVDTFLPQSDQRGAVVLALLGAPCYVTSTYHPNDTTEFDGFSNKPRFVPSAPQQTDPLLIFLSNCRLLIFPSSGGKRETRRAEPPVSHIPKIPSSLPSKIAAGVLFPGGGKLIFPARSSLRGPSPQMVLYHFLRQSRGHHDTTTCVEFVPFSDYPTQCLPPAASRLPCPYLLVCATPIVSPRYYLLCTSCTCLTSISLLSE